MLTLNIAAIQTYNSQSGLKVDNSRNFSKLGQKLSSSDHAADLGDEYFRKTNDFPVSPGMAAAGIEIIGAGALWRCFPGPATIVNLLTTVGETTQVLVSKLKFKNKYLKDGFLAWFQVLSGAFGFLGVAKETFFDEHEQDYENVPVFEKVTLSGASVLNVFLMLSGAVEKSLLSMVCWNRDDKQKEGSEYRASLTSALSDRRCHSEWALMTAIPWISNIGFFKKILDIVIPFQALREGFDTFIENPKASLLPEKFAKSKGFQNSIKTVVNPISLLVKENLNDKKEEENKYKLCWPFNYCIKFLIGTENYKGGKGQDGLRNFLLEPLFKLLSFGKLKPPLYYLDNNNNIVVEFEEVASKSKAVSQEQKRQTTPDKPTNSQEPVPADTLSTKLAQPKISVI
ncbi:MAG: hypothetical protein A3I68_07185 [Candidatus Melainabacteria bacterium RIFCSPLOWO2_02_FULL_35_15]|nr:MAG: hypothetical protein A3I68_07185 [Candidatus Melainabacteria bacterium RIFCSPLOWO2_02_FULL_35_15]